MKQWLLFLCVTFICIAFIGWKEFYKTAKPNSRIIFSANNKAVTYSLEPKQHNTPGIIMSGNLISNSDFIYNICGGNTPVNNLQIQFAIRGTLKPGENEFNSGTTIIAYKSGDSTYFSDGKGFAFKVISYQNKVLNGTFSGTLKTQYGTPLIITNGKFINVPATE